MTPLCILLYPSHTRVAFAFQSLGMGLVFRYITGSAADVNLKVFQDHSGDSSETSS